MNTTICVSAKVKDEIKEFGSKGETYDQILTRILDSARRRQLQELLMDESDCITIQEAKIRLNN